MPDSVGSPNIASKLTAVLATRSSRLRAETLPADTVTVAKQCLLDFLGVSIAGSAEAAASHLKAEMIENGGSPVATIIGDEMRLPAVSAALVNGTAAHALDYDDVSMAMPGHASAPILPAVLAAAEESGASGSVAIAAYVAGNDLAGRLGMTIAPDHYDGIGFHSTGTVGSFGAAAAVANLLGLDAGLTATALGIAGTQAAGLRSMFGTMCKPFHAGKAAQNGLLAVRLARRGMTSRPDVVECSQGFADTQSADWHPERALADPYGGFHVHDTLFKFYASCYGTHGVVGAAMALKERHHLKPALIRKIDVAVEAAYDRVCNIVEPGTGLEAKFSLAQTIAMAFDDRDLSQPAAFADGKVNDPVLVDLRRKVSVRLEAGRATLADMRVTLTDGTVVETTYDSGIPNRDLPAQGRRIEAKFLSLVAPLWGEDRARTIVATVAELESAPNILVLTSLLQPPR